MKWPSAPAGPPWPEVGVRNSFKLASPLRDRQDGPTEVEEVQHRDDQADPADEEGQEEVYRHF